MTSRSSAFSFTLSLILWYCVLISAEDTTAQLPTSTLLPDGNQQATVGWVSNPKRRGTLTIIIECLTTIFACTWTVLHLNVPAITDSTKTRVLRKVKWMAITVLFPEFIFAKAVCELRFALYNTLDKMYRSITFSPEHSFEIVSEAKVQNGRSCWVIWAWTVEFEPVKSMLYKILLQHSPYVDNLSPGQQMMDQKYGSRSVHELDNEGKMAENLKTFFNKSFSDRDRHLYDRGIAVVRVQKWTLTHAYYVNMGGIVGLKRMKQWTEEGRQPYLTHSYSVVRGDHLAVSGLKTWGLGHPLRELRLSANDIKDKSKADWIVKTIAVIQIGRLILDLITRGAGGQPVTQLEIATASFAVFAIVTHLINWWKPKDITQPTAIHAVVDQGTEEDQVERTTEPFFARLWSPSPPPHRYADTISPGNRITNDELWIGKRNSTTLAWSLMAGSCLVFGGIHCIAWSFRFPTRVEQHAWQAAALVSTTLPIFALAGSFSILRYRPRDVKRRVTGAVKNIFDEYGTNLLIADHEWWDAFTTAVNTEEWENWIDGHADAEMKKDKKRLEWELEKLSNLRSSLKELRPIKYGSRDAERLINIIWDICSKLRDPRDQAYGLRDQYQGWMKKKHPSLHGNLGGLPYGGPEGVFHWILSRCAQPAPSDEEKGYRELRKNRDIQAQRLSRFLNIISAIFYTVARLVLIAIMFSSLRAAPNGVYDTAEWARFVPSFS